MLLMMIIEMEGEKPEKSKRKHSSKGERIQGKKEKRTRGCMATKQKQ